MSFTDQGMPTHQQLVVPVLRAVVKLGGSAKSKDIVDQVLDDFPNADELLELMYPNRPTEAVFPDRITWARSTAKKIGALEQPSRGMYLTTDLTEELLAMSEQQALVKILELDRKFNRAYRERLKAETSGSRETEEEIQPHDSSTEEPPAEVAADSVEDDVATGTEWNQKLLARLHKLPPEGFEKFVIYLLKRYGLTLRSTGRSGDEGIDAIGMAPLSPVLSSRVAVQVKRYQPDGKPIGRETVALFQRDAQTKGAERAILVTLSRFTEPARNAAIATTPTKDLIDGETLAKLIREDGESGVTLRPTVDERWFDRFE